MIYLFFSGRLLEFKQAFEFVKNPDLLKFQGFMTKKKFFFCPVFGQIDGIIYVWAHAISGALSQ